MPIMNYSSGVWGYDNYTKPQVLQNRISRFYLGVNRFAPVAATKIEMDWLDCRDARWLEMLRLFNRINVMPDDRLPKIIYKWDRSLDLNTWWSEIQHIASYLGLNTLPDDGETYNLTYAYNKLLEKNRISWQLQANIKPKLRTFVNIHDYSSTQTLVRSNITRFQRSLVAQIKMGILPLKYETDRYQGIPPENRLCKICSNNDPEDETHFLFKCPTLNPERNVMINAFSEKDSNIDFLSNDYILQFRQMMNEDNLYLSAVCIEKLYLKRRNVIYM